MHRRRRGGFGGGRRRRVSHSRRGRRRSTTRRTPRRIKASAIPRMTCSNLRVALHSGDRRIKGKALGAFRAKRCKKSVGRRGGRF